MADEPGRSRLGRGLAALIGDVGDEMGAVERARGQRLAPIEFLRPNPRNPRKSFDDSELDDLAQSIRERGIIQPILVRSVPGLVDVFEIIAGERRWRAAQRAGLHEAPIVLVEASDKDALEIAIVENVQRSDLNALDEAQGYEQLMSEFGYTQLDLSKVIGKSRSHVANTLRLMKLPDSVRKQVAEGQLSAGHARALLAVSDPEAVARKVVAEGLTVRDVERLAQEPAGRADTASRAKAAKDPDTRALEQALEDVLGLKVDIAHKGHGGGQLTIRYRTLEQLEGVCRRLKS
ncbi:MAG: ParB/RepB/Spo0J family partition protein [Hyphomicrobiales bacterium]|nr:ParB/RepB/Spo0J family partition protein [Hyphomicrobiales bacterium]